MMLTAVTLYIEQKNIALSRETERKTVQFQPIHLGLEDETKGHHKVSHKIPGMKVVRVRNKSECMAAIYQVYLLQCHNRDWPLSRKESK